MNQRFPTEERGNHRVLIVTGKNINVLNADFFSGFINLVEVRIQCCKITRIAPDAFRSLNLRYLNLSHNNIVQVPNINHMTNMRLLDMSFNEITRIDGVQLANLPDLRRINFERNNICQIENFPEHFIGRGDGILYAPETDDDYEVIAENVDIDVDSLPPPTILTRPYNVEPDPDNIIISMIFNILSPEQLTGTTGNNTRQHYDYFIEKFNTIYSDGNFNMEMLFTKNTFLQMRENLRNNNLTIRELFNDAYTNTGNITTVIKFIEKLHFLVSCVDHLNNHEFEIIVMLPSVSVRERCRTVASLNQVRNMDDLVKKRKLVDDVVHYTGQFGGSIIVSYDECNYV